MGFMCSCARQLPGGERTDVDHAPAPARII